MSAIRVDASVSKNIKGQQLDVVIIREKEIREKNVLRQTGSFSWNINCRSVFVSTIWS